MHSTCAGRQASGALGQVAERGNQVIFDHYRSLERRGLLDREGPPALRRVSMDARVPKLEAKAWRASQGGIA